MVWENMRAEASHSAKLNHPAICPILSAATHIENGSLQMSLVLPYFPTDFSDYFVFDSTLPPPFILFVQRILEALAECDRNDISHLDVKPQNILCNLTHAPSLSDFGLANICLGTPGYQHIDCVLNENAHEIALESYLNVWSTGDVCYLLALLHTGIRKLITKYSCENYFMIERKVSPHLLLPWGDLSHLYTRLKELEKLDTPEVSNTAEAISITVGIDSALDLVIDDLSVCDCSSWIAFEDYKLELLLKLLKASNPLHGILDKAISYKKIKGNDAYIKNVLRKIKAIISQKILEMRKQLKTPPKTATPYSVAIYHMLHPDSRKSAAQVLNTLNTLLPKIVD